MPQSLIGHAFVWGVTAPQELWDVQQTCLLYSGFCSAGASSYIPDICGLVMGCLSLPGCFGEQLHQMNGQVQRVCEHVQADQPGAAAAIRSSGMASPHQASGSGSAEVCSLLLPHARALLVLCHTLHASSTPMQPTLACGLCQTSRSAGVHAETLCSTENLCGATVKGAARQVCTQVSCTLSGMRGVHTLKLALQD